MFENENMRQSATQAVLTKFNGDYVVRIHHALIGDVTCIIGATFSRREQAMSFIESFGFAAFSYVDMSYDVVD